MVRALRRIVDPRPAEARLELARLAFETVGVRGELALLRVTPALPGTRLDLGVSRRGRGNNLPSCEHHRDNPGSRAGCSGPAACTHKAGF